MQVKRYEFEDGFNLITSGDENSVGKTTLLRSILFAFGENVPGTQGFKFSAGGKEFILVLLEGNRRISLKRSGQTLVYREAGSDDRYALPYDLYALKQRLFGIKNELQADNLLGACYIDQDKGWTLLNRGKVISGISFKIENFIRGLSMNDQLREQTELANIEQEIKRYAFAKQAAGYQRDVLDDESQPIPSKDASKDYAKLQQLNMRASYLQKRISAIRKAQRDNKKFREYVAQLKIRVRVDGGETIAVTEENLDGFDDQDRYLDAQVQDLAAQLDDTGKTITRLQASLSADDKLFELGSEIDLLDRQIAGLKIDASMFEKTLDALREKKKSIEDAISASSTHFDSYTFISETVASFTKALDINEEYIADNHGIFTDNIKEKSGSYYQALVLAFRLAYAKAVERFCGFRPPLIIDSPRNGEISSKNFTLAMKLVEEQFEGWQIIMASIKADDIPATNVITIKNQLMEDAKTVTDLSETW